MAHGQVYGFKDSYGKSVINVARMELGTQIQRILHFVIIPQAHMVPKFSLFRFALLEGSNCFLF